MQLFGIQFFSFVCLSLFTSKYIIIIVIIIIIIIIIHRVYQHRGDSLHSHPLVPHKNGSLFNNKSGGISRTHNAYHVRDIHWTQKHRKCVRVTSQAGKTAPKKIGQHAGNTLETRHGWSVTTFKYSKDCPVYWPYIPPTQVKIIFALHIKNTRSLFRKYNLNPENFTAQHKNLIDEIEIIHREYLELNVLRNRLDPFGHGWLWWNKIDRTLDKWFKGCKSETCIKSVSRILSTDYTQLFLLIYNSAKTKYGKFDNVDFILKNPKLLSWIQRQMQYRMTISEIKTIIYKEWCASGDLEFEEIFGIREESEEESLEIPKRAGKKEKYSKKFVYLFIFVR